MPVLDNNVKEQLSQYINLLENDIVIKLSVGTDDASNEMKELIDEIEAMSPKISVENVTLKRTPSFSINNKTNDSGVVFAGIPLGHEFTSLILALLQVSGRPPKITEAQKEQINKLNQPLHFETYVSLGCHNCPDVVQALNTISVLNKNASHTMIEGGLFRDEIENKNIMAVPAIYLNGDYFDTGRMSLDEILERLGGAQDPSEFDEKETFDILVVGGGPAGASSAIYSARKGLKTGIIAERFGGQVTETGGIENLIGVSYTDGPKLSSDLETHVREYNVDIMNLQRAKSISKKDLIEVELENGAVLKSKSVIISTGAKWRQLGVQGEDKFKNKGVAYCPHCDGPLFEGKEVAVVGGGNSGIEAAIDLAGIAKHVTVLEFSNVLKADTILQDRLSTLNNVTVLKNVSVDEIVGDDTVSGIYYKDNNTNERNHIKLDGVFVQIGLVPNTEWLDGIVARNKYGEIIVDKNGATNVNGIFAAGDCTDTTYKQIIISMGSGATAALSAFDYLIRN